MVARPIALLAAVTVALAAREAHAQHPNVRVSSTSSSPEEVTIALNPLNPLHLAAGANLEFRWYSFDGGLTWNEDMLASSMGVWGDPAVVYDAHGNLYYAHLSNPPPPGSWLDRIVEQRSTDGGMSYDDGVGIGLDPPKDQDKPGLAVDPSKSPYAGRLYAAWTQFDR